MPNNLNYDVWLIGPGGMGIEYANVLSSLGKNFLTIGREKILHHFLLHQPIKMFFKGGLEKFLQKNQKNHLLPL